jgi:undecaprenyl diphosphate synthase
MIKRKLQQKPTRPSLSQLQEEIDPARLPRHVAIIMDGNGRWAMQHGFKDRIRGHRAGVNAVRQVVTACGELGIRVLTLYSFSKENWNRSKREIAALMALLRRYLRTELPELQKENVRLVASGSLDDLPPHTRRILDEAIAKTAKNTGLILNLALSYGSRTEIVDATKRILRDFQAGRLTEHDLTLERFATYLYHSELGDPDLLIRTSGEMRVSNFLLWQIAYTEIYVTKTLWPDFDKTDLMEALIAYQKRERRFGKA